MDDFVLLGLLFVGAAFVWLAARGRRLRRHEANLRSKHLEALPLSVATRPHERSADERLADALEVVRQTIREQADKELQPLSAELDDARRREREATDRAENLGLSTALTFIHDEMEHWPSWSKGPDFDRQLVPGLTYISGEVAQTPDFRDRTTTNVFSFVDGTYRLSVANEQTSFDNEALLADLTLEVRAGDKWHEVFAADVSKDLMRDVSMWQTTSVKLFELGDWMTHVTALNELFRAKKERQHLELQLSISRPKAARLSE